jgi:site-specific DNA-methyltransferase (adenine-specific)
MRELESTRRDPLARIINARAELELSRDLAEVAAIKEFAVLAREYARAKKLGKEAIDYATEIVNRAERRQGQLIHDEESEQGRRTDLELRTPGVGSSTIRQQAGFKVSSRSQQLASLPDEIFEAHASKPVTKLARLARELETEQRRAAAIVEDVCGDITIRHCSAADLASEVEADSIDLIFTDPPYPEEFLPTWSDLGALAAKTLKPGGLVVAYTGQMFLPEVMSRLSVHLDYWWCYAIRHTGAFFQLKARRIQVAWKPLLVYRKPGGALPAWTVDFTDEGSREKTGHDWQQAVGEAAYWIDQLTGPGAHIVDPFVGSGTTAAACKTLGRRFTGCDVDRLAVKTAQERVA